MAKQSLKVSLWMIWGLSVVGMLALAISGVFYLDRAESNVDHFVRQPIALRHSSTMLYALGLQRGQALRNVILDPGNSKAYENYAKAEEGFQAEMQQFAMLKAEDAKQVDLQDRVRQLAAAWSPLQQKVLALGREGKVDEAKQLLISQETPQWRKLREDLLELGTRSSTSAEAARNELQATLHTSKILAIAIGVAGFVVISFAVGYLGRNVYRQIGGEPGYAGTVLAKLSDGDLRQKVEIGSDAQGSLLLAIQEMQARIRTLVAQVAAAAQSVVGASGSMRDDAVRLTATANQQGSSTAAIAATVDTFRVGIARMSEGAKEAGWLAKESSDQAKRTLEVVSSAVTTMHTVSTETTLASRSVDKLSQNISQISSILEKIKDIADQTNLLALNAAIEAARAGEQGRGFAVVADEVRKLAELTAKSTTEISEIVGGIDTTSGEVVSSMARAHAQSEQGADKADQVGLAVQAMHGLTVQVTDALGGIADRLQEQLAASGEIADAVQTIAQSSRDVHEISTASSKHAATLVQLSGNLTGCIDQFRL